VGAWLIDALRPLGRSVSALVRRPRLLLFLPAALSVTIALSIVWDPIGRWLPPMIAVFPSTVVLQLFRVALSDAASQALDGGSPRLFASVGRASRRVAAIAGYTLVGVVVMAVLQYFLLDEDGLAGAVGSVAWRVWSVGTFLAVPVLGHETHGGVGALRRSFGLFARHPGVIFVGWATQYAIMLLLFRVLRWSASPWLILPVLFIGTLLTVHATAVYRQQIR
jgi:hypothetical protein